MVFTNMGQLSPCGFNLTPVPMGVEFVPRGDSNNLPLDEVAVNKGSLTLRPVRKTFIPLTLSESFIGAANSL
jgi:hypothetical protein